MAAASPAAVPPVQPMRPRRSPLALRVGDAEVILLAGDVDLLGEAIDLLGVAIERARSETGRTSSDRAVTDEVLAELSMLKTLLDTPVHGFADPALEPGRAQIGLLRQVLADLSGYHRIDLPPALRELRSLLVRQ